MGSPCISVSTLGVIVNVIIICQALDATDSGINYETFDYGNYKLVGDMIVPTTINSTERVGAQRKIWPNGLIPYSIGSEVSQPLAAIVYQAINYYHKYTCIRFRLATNADTYSLRFQNATTPLQTALCASLIGWNNRRNQPLFLGPKCNFGSMIHELMHAVGFYHEHTRPDRDKYINVHFENMANQQVKTHYQRDDLRCPSCTYYSYGVKYNYESIMHYCDHCTSKNDSVKTFDVIKTSDGIGDRKKIGQREGFSYGDWLIVNRRYNCKTTTKPPPISSSPPVQSPTEIDIGGIVDVAVGDKDDTQFETSTERPSICNLLPIC